ncbi:MAG: hypothetical protein LBE21_10820 [Pseudomonadales bacterium]|jgi:hypothetical protein|nr:hypothetical protein [Pseudomonadales bacterium]
MKLIVQSKLTPPLLLGAVLALATTAATAQTASANQDGGVGLWPKISFDTVASVDYARMNSNTGPDRGTGAVLWADSTLLVDFNDALSVTGLFQFKPREALPESNPNRELFINRGLDRREGGKMKELYVRYGDWRAGKFVQNFGRAYTGLLPGPWATDFTEEPEVGYEPSEMIGLEKVHVFDDESQGWRQLTLAAFMVDRTFLHQSFPYNEGMIHYEDGGVGNTHGPENVMATFDVINQPVGNWAHASYQAGVIRWGKTFEAEKGELWTTLGGDLVVPLRSGIAETLRGEYSQLHFFLEAVNRDNFEGIDGSSMRFLSASAEYLTGGWIFDLTATQRWTSEPLLPRQTDELYSFNIGYGLPSATNIDFSGAYEQVGGQRGFYYGIRVTQSFGTCSKCMMRGRAY